MNKKQTNNTSDYPELINHLRTIFDSDKAENIVSINLEPVYGYSTYFLVLTALSNVHLKKLTQDAISYLKTKGIYLQYLPNQLDLDSGWVVLDCPDLVVHIFTKEKREFYDLENLWKEAIIIEDTILS